MTVSFKIQKSSSFAIRRKSRWLLFFATLLSLAAIFSLQIKAAVSEYSNIYAMDAKMELGREAETDENIKIIFNQPVVLMGTERIDISPAVEFSLDLSGENKVLEIRHEKPFLAETKYEIVIKDVRGISGTMLSEKEFSFYTVKEDKAVVAMEDGKKEFTSFAAAKEKYIPPESSRPKELFEIEPKFKSGKYIDVDITHQTMTLFEDGIRVNSFLISSGMRGYETKRGVFAIKKKEVLHWSVSYRLWMPYSMNFSGPLYIHELPYWPSGYREGENHLGMKASHGCIRLGIGPAKYVFKWSEIGTPLYIHD